MVSPNDYQNTYNPILYKFKNQANSAENLRHKFVTAGQTTFIAISKDLVKKFSIDDNTWIYQEADDSDNSIRLIFIKNRNGRPEALPTQPDDQDYGE